MSKALQYYIGLNSNGCQKEVLLIGYMADGSYFLKDLFRFRLQDRKCWVVKLPTDVTNNGVRKVRPVYSAITTGDAKLSHHITGNAQISGEGILSGFDNGVPKGASLESFPLDNTNDGGAVFTYRFFGQEIACRDTKERSIVLNPEFSEKLTSTGDGIFNSYVIMGYYFLKSDIRPQNPLPDVVLYNSLDYGPIYLRLLPSPESCPGILGIRGVLCHGNNFNIDCGFALSGAPGKIYNKKFCDNLSIIYPAPADNKADVCLDYIK